MVKTIKNADDMIDYLYNQGIGDSVAQLKSVTKGVSDVKFALAMILKNVKMAPQKVKDVIKLTGEVNVKASTLDFFAFYCSYVDNSYITKLYGMMEEKEFNELLSKLTNIPMILNSPVVCEYGYIYTTLVDKLHSEVAIKNIKEMAKKERENKQG